MNTFIGLTNIQHGVIILTCFFMVSAVSSLLINVTEFNDMMPFGNLMIYLFNIYMLLTWTFAILGSISMMHLAYLKRAMVMWAIFIVMWTFVVVCSFFNYGITLLCLEYRCPESFWTFNNTWHDIHDPEPIFRPHMSKDNEWMMPSVDKKHVKSQPLQFESESPPSLLNTFSRLAVKEKEINREKLKMKNDQNDEILPINDGNDDKYNQKYARTKNLAVKCLMSILHATILMYSWLVLFSFYSKICERVAQRLCCNACCDDL